MSCSLLTFFCPLLPVLIDTPPGARSPRNSCQSFVMLEWLAFSEWNSFTLKCYRELSFAFKPFSFCGVASFFSSSSSLKDYQTEHRRDLVQGARVYDHPCVYFLRSERKAQSTFYVSLTESKKNGMMEMKRWKEGRKDRKKKGKKEGKEGDDFDFDYRVEDFLSDVPLKVVLGGL